MNSVIKKGIAVISTALLMTGNVLFPIADAAEIAANDEKVLFSDDFASYDSPTPMRQASDGMFRIHIRAQSRGQTGFCIMNKT